MYDWSESTLNPEIDKILEVLGRYNKLADISSNFIAPWRLAPESYNHISHVVFSICSLDDAQYKRVYGADLSTTLANFRDFLAMRNAHNPNIRVDVNWLQYKFSTPEETRRAQEYFASLGDVNLSSSSYFAYVNDGHANMDYCNTKGRSLTGYDIEQVKQDIDLDRVDRILANPDKSYNCPLKNKYQLYITEEGQLALCCAVTSKDKEYNLGDVLKLRRRDIFRLKKSQGICKKCEEAGLAYLYCYVYCHCELPESVGSSCRGCS